MEYYSDVDDGGLPYDADNYAIHYYCLDYSASVLDYGDCGYANFHVSYTSDSVQAEDSLLRCCLHPVRPRRRCGMAANPSGGRERPPHPRHQMAAILMGLWGGSTTAYRDKCDRMPCSTWSCRYALSGLAVSPSGAQNVLYHSLGLLGSPRAWRSCRRAGRRPPGRPPPLKHGFFFRRRMYRIILLHARSLGGQAPLRWLQCARSLPPCGEVNERAEPWVGCLASGRVGCHPGIAVFSSERSTRVFRCRQECLNTTNGRW